MTTRAGVAPLAPGAAPEPSRPHGINEPPTGRSSQTMRLYGELLKAFDALDDGARTELLELANEWPLMAPADRAAMLRLVMRCRNRT